MSSFWDGAKQVLGLVAPTLASAAGGPIAGAVTSVIINALGLAPDTTPEQAAAAVVGATPDQLIQIQKADQAFKLAMDQLQLDTEKLAFDDKANARAREVALPKDHTPALLALFLTLGFFGLLGVMAFHAAPTGSEGVLNAMTGALGSSFGMMVAYYYGASATGGLQRPLVTK